MNIVLITPQGPTSRTGNKVAASRWARILRKLGHRVRVGFDYDGRSADLMVAVHAWRSAEAIARFKARYPKRPLILQLSGTDIYGYLKTDPATTLRSMEMAERLVALNDLAWRVLPRRLRARLLVIHQSATAPPKRNPSRRATVISVIGHLRDVKDPLRAAQAARLLPADSRVRIEQVGRAYTEDWAERARAEMAVNARYTWRGDVPASAVRRLLGRSHAMVISSLSEGGANVISEAAVAGVPILASRMDGNVGLLGADYPGYFPTGDTCGLANLLKRVEHDRSFVRRLAEAVAQRATLFRPEREVVAWRRLLGALGREQQKGRPAGGPSAVSSRSPSRRPRSAHARRRR
jgi:putative glycosyltransferase (TIGR04348 family)